MAGVRRKKTRRNTTIKITKNQRKRKNLKPAIADQTLKQHWDHSKTLQQNMRDLGLAYDPNVAVKIPKRKKVTKKDLLKLDREGEMEVEKSLPAVVNTAVIEEFEKQAQNGVKTERHIAAGEAKFLMELIKAHGTKYKSMFKDKRNTYQHTAKQLKRKCEGLLESSMFPKYQEMFPDLITTTEEVMET